MVTLETSRLIWDDVGHVKLDAVLHTEVECHYEATMVKDTQFVKCETTPTLTRTDQYL